MNKTILGHMQDLVIKCKNDILLLTLSKVYIKN